MASRRCCIHFGDGPFFTPLTMRSAKPGHRSGRFDGHAYRAFTFTRGHRNRRRLHSAETGGGEVAGDPRHARTIRPVRRQADFDDRIVQPGIGRERGTDRRVGGQID